MASIEEEEDRDLAGSQDGSSDNEVDETMRDADEGDGDNEPDADADAEQEAESPSNGSHASEGAAAAPQPSQDVAMTPPDAATDLLSAFHPTVRPECLTASTFDIVPTTAAPHSTSINAVTATADMRWVFSGGSDGYVRKFNWVDSINSKLMLTVAQRHPFVDSVVKAGVLMTYWENMDGNSASPVYSLASHSEGLWLLTGLESGAIRLQSVRHEEGRELAVLQQHTSAVSSLTLTSDEKSLLSGSWDKRVYDWDLNTGQIRRAFGGSARQISALQLRPESNIPVPSDTMEDLQPNGTFSSNYQASIPENFSTVHTSHDQGSYGDGAVPQPGSPTDSLFGGADSLFGDAEGGAGEGAPADHSFSMGEDDLFGQTLTNGALPEESAPVDFYSINEPNGVPPHPAAAGDSHTQSIAPDHKLESHGEEFPNGISQPAVNGLGHAEPEPASQSQYPTQFSQPEPNTAGPDNTFLAASIDGTIRVWDRRLQDPVARISPYSAPPWCTNACWSPDGNYIYAGRRNGTVEEFSLHKGLRTPERTLKFPQGSGPVTAVRAMPNGRHIVCASHDILRLYDLKHEQTRHSTVPFLIVPGHRTGTISQLYTDQACRFMISTSGNRGWEGNTTEVLLGYEIGVPR